MVRFREAERGDTLFSVDLASLVAKNRIHIGQRAGVPVPEKLAPLSYRVSQMTVSPDGRFLAVATDSPSGRFETNEPYGIYVADLLAGALHRAIHTQVVVGEIHWARDSRHIFFTYFAGTPESSYQASQVKLFWVDAAGGKVVRWASRFTGEVASAPWTGTGAFDVTQDGAAFSAGRLGTEAQPYSESSADAEFVKQPAWAGTYEMFSAARHSPRVAFVYSSLQRPSRSLPGGEP